MPKMPDWRLPFLLAVSIILIEAIVPGTAHKGDVADILRRAASTAGCETPVVAVNESRQSYFHITVTCRDAVKGEEVTDGPAKPTP